MTILDAAYRTTVDDHIRACWRYRQWYRANRWADWPDLRKEAEVELRCLVGVARRARAMAAAQLRADLAEVDALFPEPSWTESEKREAWGR